jgi:hypothetical protein
MDAQYKLVNGVMVELSQQELAQRLLEEEAETKRDKRPLAMGADMVALAQNAFEGQDSLLRMALIHYFDNFPLPITILKNLSGLSDETKTLLTGLAAAQGNGTVKFSLLGWLESTTCNPLTQTDFNKLIAMLDLIPDAFGPVRELYKQLALGWKQTVRFKPEQAQQSPSGPAQVPPSEIQQLVKDGNCPTPQSLDKRGRKCGKRAASERQNKS